MILTPTIADAIDADLPVHSFHWKQPRRLIASALQRFDGLIV